MFAHLGITWDLIESEPNQTYYSSLVKLKEDQEKKLDEFMDRIYEDFISKVAYGRNIPRG